MPAWNIFVPMHYEECVFIDPELSKTLTAQAPPYQGIAANADEIDDGIHAQRPLWYKKLSEIKEPVSDLTSCGADPKLQDDKNTSIPSPVHADDTKPVPKSP